MKFRKKPVVINAIQYTGNNDSELKEFVKTSCEFDNDTFVIKTLEGNMVASIGDWIIQGVKDEFYPCREDIFDETYESLDAPSFKSYLKMD